MIALCPAVEVPDVRNVQDLPKADKKALFFSRVEREQQ